MKTSELISELVDAMSRYGDIKVNVCVLTNEGDKEFSVSGTGIYAKEFSIEFEPTNDEIEEIYELKEKPEEEI